MKEKQQKLPLPPLLAPVHPFKKARKRKTETEKAATIKKLETARGKTRINIGLAFQRWRQLRELNGLKSDAMVAVFLLDSYEQKQTFTSYKRGPGKRGPPVSPIGEESLSDGSKLGKLSDGSLYTVKRRDRLCDQETQAEDLTLSTTNMTGEEGCTEITFDVSEINFATDEDSSCTNADEQEEGEEEEVEEEEEEEEEEESDGSDPEWCTEMSETNLLEKNVSGEKELNSDSKVPRKVRELCPECGVHFNVAKTHTCEYKIKKFPCNICGKRCKDVGALKSHSRVHEAGYEHLCKFCMAPFNTRLDKLAHQRAHVPSSRPYKCPDCAMTFAKLRERNFHLKEHRDQNVSCPLCPLVFPTPHCIKRHMVVHTGVKPFVCEFCFRSFNQPGHLTSHLRLHTGEKPYQCKHCDESFNHNVSLKSHVTRYHKGASDSEPMGDTPERMEPPGTGIEEVNEELVIGDTEDTGGDVIEGDPKLKEEPKHFKKTYYRSMGRPKGRPKRDSATTEKDLISALRGEGPDPTTAADTSEEGHLRRATSKNIESDGSDRDRTSEFTEEDEEEGAKVLRKGKSKASQRPKSFEHAEDDFESGADNDPTEEAKATQTRPQTSGKTGRRRGRPRKNPVV
ncbi:unnamed protein product [Arctogadus glacialis]